MAHEQWQLENYILTRNVRHLVEPAHVRHEENESAARSMPEQWLESVPRWRAEAAAACAAPDEGQSDEGNGFLPSLPIAHESEVQDPVW